MKKKDIIDAVGDIDYDMVEEAEAKPVENSGGNMWLKLGTVAAVLVLFLVFVGLSLLLNRQDEPILPPTTNSNDITKSPCGTTFIPTSTTASASIDTQDITTKRPSQSGVVAPQIAPLEYKTIEEYIEYEKGLGEKSVGCYYTPSKLPNNFEFDKILKRADVYVAVYYTLADAKFDS